MIVRDTVRAPARVDHGRGILVFMADEDQLVTTATVLGSVVERNTEVGIFGQAVDLTIERTAVLDTRPRTEDMQTGRGIAVQSGDHLHPSNLVVRDCLLDLNHNTSLYAAGTLATIERTEIRNTSADQGVNLFGDAIVAINYFGLALGSTSVADCTLATSDRAGIASFGATVAVRNTAFECNAIEMNGQDSEAAPFGFEDQGGNHCGCADEEHDCQLLTTELSAPEPIGD